MSTLLMLMRIQELACIVSLTFQGSRTASLENAAWDGRNTGRQGNDQVSAQRKVTSFIITGSQAPHIPLAGPPRERCG